MPSITDNEAEHPEKIQLLLPSRLSDKIRPVICSEDIVELEGQLRYAQAHEAIANITDLLCARTIAISWRRRSWLTGNDILPLEPHCSPYGGLVTGRVLQVLKPEDIRGINERLLHEEEKAKYRDDQRSAGVSESEIRELLIAEVGNVPTVEDASVLAKNTAPSWIWFVGREEGVTGDQAQQMEASLRVEWCKARA
uniref:Uncharacterized protein n=1 Tax=Moniliophthora roreri TaxID=221103 RepID=A0A0W0GEI8_MONRR